MADDQKQYDDWLKQCVLVPTNDNTGSLRKEQLETLREAIDAYFGQSSGESGNWDTLDKNMAWHRGFSLNDGFIIALSPPFQNKEEAVRFIMEDQSILCKKARTELIRRKFIKGAK